MADRPLFDLLPEIYREDPALNALASAFERGYLNLERCIDLLPKRLYRESLTPEGYLDFVGRLVGIQNDGQQFTPAQMRRLIPVGIWIHRMKGTMAALRLLLRLYLAELCGREIPFRLEEPDQPRVLIVRIPLIPPLDQKEERLRLERLLGDYIPAGVELRLSWTAGQALLGSCRLGGDSFFEVSPRG